MKCKRCNTKTGILTGSGLCLLCERNGVIVDHCDTCGREIEVINVDQPITLCLSCIDGTSILHFNFGAFNVETIEHALKRGIVKEVISAFA